jgi:hypothetical protein
MPQPRYAAIRVALCEANEDVVEAARLLNVEVAWLRRRLRWMPRERLRLDRPQKPKPRPPLIR